MSTARKRKQQPDLSYINEQLRSLAIPIKDIRFDPHNARKHNRRNLDVVKNSLKTKGQTKCIVVWKEKMTIAAGNGTVAAALELGWTHVAANVRSFADEHEAKEYALTDNRSAELAEWDNDVLFPQVRELKDVGFKMVEFGWNDDDFDQMQREFSNTSNNDNSEPPMPDPSTIPKKAKIGDVWILGPHKLICGDCTQAKVIKRLMGKDRANMVFTDPPYGVKYKGQPGKGNHRIPLKNDSLGLDGTRALVADAARQWPVVPGAAFYVCSPSGDMETAFRVALHFDVDGVLLKQAIAWVKDRFVLGRSDYHWRHETILYGWVEGAAHFFVKDRTQDTVWNVPRPQRSDDHPTMKPIPLVMKAIMNSSKHGDIVFDGFAGSGQTIFAAQRTERVARCVELDERHCDTIVRRWEVETGEEAVVQRGRKKIPWGEIEAE